MKFRQFKWNAILETFVFMKDTWDQKQDGLLSEIEYNGFFQGEGAATTIGRPGGSAVSPLFFPANDYDFANEPIDIPDLLAKNHDFSQHGLSGYINPLDDVRDVVYNGDKEFLKGHLDYQKKIGDSGGGPYFPGRGSFIDPITQRKPSREAIETSLEATALFGAIVRFKDWKRKRMNELKLDTENPTHMRDERLHLDEWEEGTIFDKEVLDAAFGERRLKKVEKDD